MSLKSTKSDIMSVCHSGSSAASTTEAGTVPKAATTTDSCSSRRTGRTGLKFWLIFALVYITGTLGLGWLTGHPFKLWQWAALTACMLAGRGTAEMALRLIRRRVTPR